jgi:type I restriction enzyme S subunit
MKTPLRWKIKTLQEVAEIQTGLSKSASRVGDFVRLPYIRVANVQDGRLDLSEVKEINVPKDAVDRYRVIQGDLLLTEGGDFDKLGRGALWTGAIRECVHQNHIFVVRANSNLLDRRFLALLTQSVHGRGYFQSCSKQSTNLASINSTQLKQFPVPLPPLPEQQKIADILGTWDEALEKLDALIAAKARRKQALMQQLLTGHRRLPGFSKPWAKPKLGDLFLNRTENNRLDLPLLSITADQGVVSRDSLTKRDTSSEDKSKYLRIAPGDIGYNTMRMWQGVSALSSLEGIVSPAYTILNPTERIDGKFTAHFFKLPHTISLFHRYSQGLVDDTLNLKFPSFAVIEGNRTIGRRRANRHRRRPRHRRRRTPPPPRATRRHRSTEARPHAKAADWESEGVPMTAPMTRFSGLPELARIAWGRIPPTTRSNFRLVLQPIFCFISFNRPLHASLRCATWGVFLCPHAEARE